MKKILCIVLCAFLLISAVPFASAADYGQAANFTLTPISGSSSTVSALSGSQVVLVFGRMGENTCGKTNSTLKALNSLLSKSEYSKVKAYFLEIESTNTASAVSKNTASYTNIISCVTSETYNQTSWNYLRACGYTESSTSLPVVFFIDAAGKIVNYSTGIMTTSSIETIFKSDFGLGNTDTDKDNDTDKNTDSNVTLTVTDNYTGESTHGGACDKEWEVLRLTNKARMQNNLPPLSTFATLQKAAGTRAKELATLFEHTRPDGSDCYTALGDVGLSYRAAAENIAGGYSTPAKVVNAWLNSSGHYDNIMRSGVSHLSVGYDVGGENGINWVQSFLDNGCSFSTMTLLNTSNLTMKSGDSFDDLGVVVELKCSKHGSCYMPLIDEMCSGYDADAVGNQTITVKYQSLSATFTVENLETEKEEITGVKFADKTYTYNGEEQSIEITGTVPEGASVEYTNNKATDAGTYNATAVITASGYYTLTLTAEMTIEKKALTVSGISAEDKVYDGTTAAVISGGTISGAVAGDDVSAVFSDEGTFASASVGKNIAVTIGDVTLKGSDAGNYTVNQPSSLKATITAAEIAVKADDVQMAQGADVPTLTYTITSGQLYGDDALSGSLTTKADGKKVGIFDITQGTLKASSNYKLTFTKGALTVVDKTPQSISMSGISEKTYGDGEFSVTAIADETTQLNNFTYASSDTSVAVIDGSGKITIVGAGETTISVTESGDEEYAPATVSEKLTVNKKSIEISDIDPEAKTAALVGVIDEDDVSIDFDKLVLTLGNEIDDENVAVKVTSFVLSGEDSGNYAVATESVDIALATDNLITVTVATEHGTVTGEGSYIKGTDVTLTASADSGYKFSAWYDGDTKLSTSSSYTFTAAEDLELTAKFSKKSSGSGNSTCVVSFESNGGNNVASITYVKGSKFGALSVPKKEGYVFAGWYSDKTLKTEVTEDMSVSANMTLYAKWEAEDEEDSNSTIVLTIGSKKALVFGETITNDVAPVIKNNRTMLPIRFVAEALGAEVEWDDKARAVTITMDETEIVITIDSDTAIVNDEEIEMDSAAYIDNDRTYLPIRFVAENLGAEVTWEDETRQVIIEVK